MALRMHQPNTPNAINNQMPMPIRVAKMIPWIASKSPMVVFLHAADDDESLNYAEKPTCDKPVKPVRASQ